MTELDLTIPQIGQNQQEVRIISFAKRVGDPIGRDDVLYTIESDKAALEVESGASGTLVGWLAVEGSVVPVGAPIARVATDDESMDEVSRVHSNNGHDAEKYILREVPPAQRTFVMRLRRSQALAIPSVVRRSVDWAAVCRSAEDQTLHGDVEPSAFQMLAYGVAQSVAEHAKFRSTMPSDETIREFDHVNLGIAVGLPNGQLNVAVVPDADALDFAAFVRVLQRNIVAARAGRDQASDAVQIVLTYMGGYEIEDSIPLLVSPSVATLFIGSPYESGGSLRANLTMTFDHRLIQGVEAALFLKAIAHRFGDFHARAAI